MSVEADYTLTLDDNQTFQTIIGIGGSFTESSAQVLSELSASKREIAMHKYFAPSGAHISLTRTHMASCDFSVTNYTYAPIPGDIELEHFSIEPDRIYLLPMIKDAQKIPGADIDKGAPEVQIWGWRWAPDDQKKYHPKYAPFYRYTRDLIGGLNHHLVGWIDWNMFLNTRGGPNHARNYCLAPILVDSGRDAIYITPLYYAIAHVSKFIRPGAVRIGLSGHDDEFMATAFRNTDESIALVIFNLLESDKTYTIQPKFRSRRPDIRGQSLIIRHLEQYRPSPPIHYIHFPMAGLMSILAKVEISQLIVVQL